MNVIRSLIFYVGYFLAMLVCGVLFLPPAPFLPLASRYRLLNLYNHFIIAWFRLACGVRYEFRGHERLPAGPCVILANHQSEWETVYLQLLHRRSARCSSVSSSTSRSSVGRCACCTPSPWTARSPPGP